MSSRIEYIKERITEENIYDLLNDFGAKGITTEHRFIRSTCPMHQGDNRTAFVYNKEKHLYTCHTNCGSGDIFTLIGSLYELENFNDILIKAQEIFNIDTKGVEFNESQISKEQRAWVAYITNKQKRNQPFDISELGDIEEVPEYRGLHSVLASRSESRFIFPIRDDNGEIIGASGRAMENIKPKWKHYPKGISTGNILYTPQSHNRNNGYTYVCEGIIDAERLAGFGYNAVCTFGCNTSREQESLLLQRYDKLIYAYDNDKAGRDGTRKAVRRIKDKCIISVLELNDYKDVGEIESKEEFDKLEVIEGWKFIEEDK